MEKSAESPLPLTAWPRMHPRSWLFLVFWLALWGCRNPAANQPAVSVTVTLAVVATPPPVAVTRPAEHTRTATPSPTATSVPTPEPSPTPHLELTPYSNAELGITLQYPAAWQLSDRQAGYIRLSNAPTAGEEAAPAEVLLFISPLARTDAAPLAILTASAEWLGLTPFSSGLDIIQTVQPPTVWPYPGGEAATAVYLSRYQNRPTLVHLTALRQPEGAVLVIRLTAPGDERWESAESAIIRSLTITRPPLTTHNVAGLLPGSTLDTFLYVNEINQHVLAVTAGADVIMAVIPQGRLALDLTLLTPQGEILDSARAAGSGAINALRFQPPADGEYRLRVASHSGREGRYTLTLNRVYLHQAELLAPQAAMTLTLDGASRRAVIVAAADAPFDGQLSALDAGGVVLTGINAQFGPTPISLLAPLRFERTYMVRLRNDSTESRAATLALALTPARQVDLSAGSEIISHLTLLPDTPLDLPFSMAAPARFSLALWSETALDVTAVILDEAGAMMATLEAAADQAARAFNAPQAGNYTLRLSPAGPEGGRVTLVRYAPTLATADIRDGDRVYGWLPPGGVLTLGYVGTPGAARRVNLTAEGITIELMWLDSAENILWTTPLSPGDSAEPLLITPSEARRYLVRVRNLENREGAFTLTLDAP